MANILGLVSGKTFADNSFHNRNNRRRIFHDYPVGQFPLTGLLSLMDTEDTDSFEFGWYEKRFKTPETTIAASGGSLTLPFGTAGGTGTNAASSVTFSVGSTTTVELRRIAVADSSDFLVRNQIWVQGVPVSDTVFTDIKGVITEVGTGYITIAVSETTGVMLNTTNLITAGSTKGPVGCRIVVVGNASGEGASAGSGRLYTPINVKNYTQIFRNAFSFTRSAMKVPTEFDKTGIYRETAEDNLRAHMVEMEMAFLFGVKRLENVTENSETVPRRLTGGIEYFLKLWEAGSTYGNTAATALTDDNKRILPCTSNTVTWAVFNSWLERVFRTTNDRSFEKLCLCGSGFLSAVNTILETKATLNKDFGMQKIYGMNVVTWETAFGTVHFKTHPLFSRDSALRYNGLILDVQNLKYRALNDSDTTCLENRQANDYDGRKDEWLTEAGLEVNFPESHMYIKNMQSITAS